MGIGATLSYAVTCVYYAGRTLLLLTVQLLWFLPAYFLLERHDTRSAWLGRRGEAQVQPVLLTAYHCDKAAEESDAEPGSESGDIVTLCALHSMRPLLQQPMPVSSPPLDGTARDAEERRCVSARRAVLSVRSLHTTHVVHGAGGSLGAGSYAGEASLSSSSRLWPHALGSVAASSRAVPDPGSLGRGMRSPQDGGDGSGGVAAVAAATAVVRRRPRVRRSVSRALPIRDSSPAGEGEGEEDSERSWSNYTMATTPSASTVQHSLSVAELAMPRDGSAGATTGGGSGSGLRAARGSAVAAHASRPDRATLSSADTTRVAGESGAGGEAGAASSRDGTPVPRPAARLPAHPHDVSMSLSGRLSGDGDGAAPWLSRVTDVFFEGVPVRAAVAVSRDDLAVAARAAAVAGADGRWGRWRFEPPAWRAALSRAHAAGVAAEAKMRGAVPAWCAVHFRPLAAQGPCSSVNVVTAAVPDMPLRGQFGFLPPWYAVHARAQLLLAFVDPLLRIAAELLCCRGWGSARLCSDSDAVQEMEYQRSPVSEVHGRACGTSRGGGSSPTAAAVVAAILQPLSFCLRLLRTLVYAVVLGSTDTAALQAPSAARAMAPSLPQATASPPQHVSGSLLPRPLRLLTAAVQARIDGYVADTRHTFECLLTDTLTGTGDPGNTSINANLVTVPPVSVTAHGLATGSSNSTAAPASLPAATHVPSPFASTRNATCEKSVGVYWLHGRRPSATSTSHAPVVVLLLCPSLLQGSGLYPHAVARLSHVCQLMTLAGQWQSALATPPHGGDGEEGREEAATPTTTATGTAPYSPVSPTTRSTNSSSSSSSSKRADNSADVMGPSLAAPEWYAAVPVVELRAPAAEAGLPDDVSMPPLTLRDLRHTVERLRTQLECTATDTTTTTTTTNNNPLAAEGNVSEAVPGNPPSYDPSAAAAAHRSQSDRRLGEATRADSRSRTPSPSLPLPPRTTTTPRRPVYLVAVGWSEAASPLLELAITQQYHHHHHHSHTHAAAMVAPRLDGVVCLSHTLSSTFHLLPKQPAGAMVLHQQHQQAQHRHPLATRTAPSPLGSTRRTSFATTMTAAGTGSITSSGAASPLASPSFAARPSTSPPSTPPLLLPPPPSTSKVYAAPHMPLILSRLTTGPARLLLLMTRMEMIADALLLHRHHDTRQQQQLMLMGLQLPTPTRSRSRSPVVALAAAAGVAKSSHVPPHTAASSTTTTTGAAAAPALMTVPPRCDSLYHLLQVFFEAREEVNRAQHGLDRATILWRHQLHQRHVHRPLHHQPQASLSSSITLRQQPAHYAVRSAWRGSAADRAMPSRAACSLSAPPSRRTEDEGDWSVAACPMLASTTTGTATVSAHTMASTSRCRWPPPLLQQHGLQAEMPAQVALTAKPLEGSAAPGQSDDGPVTAATATHSTLDVPHHAATWSPSPLMARQDRADEASPMLWGMPRLETATDWEELAQSPMMTEVQQQQRLDAANITVSDLPPPPSVDPPTHLGNGAGPTHVAPTPAAFAGGTGSSGSSGGGGGVGGGVRGGALRRRFTVAHGVDADGAGPLPSTRAGHVPSLRGSAVSLSASGPLHRTWSHMSTEDVLAACTLQVVSPDGRQVAWRSNGGAGAVAGAGGNAEADFLLRPPQSRPSTAVMAATTAVAPPPAVTGVEATVAAGAPSRSPAAAITMRGRADSVASSDDDDDATPAATVATPTPEKSFAAAARHASADAGSLHEGASDRGERHRDAEVSAMLKDHHHHHRRDSNDHDTMTTSPSPSPQLRLSFFTPTQPNSSAALQSMESSRPPPPSRASSHAVATKFEASSVHPCDSPHHLRGTPPAATAPVSPPPPSPSPPTPYPTLAYVRTPALSSQAAALVELRVRSAQHAALIHRIRVPTLFVHARDDPVAPTATLPFSLLQANPWITTVLTRRGSHAVFMEGAAEVWRRPRLVVTQCWQPGHDDNDSRTGSGGVSGDDEGDDVHTDEPRHWALPLPHRHARHRGGGAGDGLKVKDSADVGKRDESAGAACRDDRSAPRTRQSLTPSPAPLPATRPPAAAATPLQASLTVAASHHTPLLAVAALTSGEAKGSAPTRSSSSPSCSSSSDAFFASSASPTSGSRGGAVCDDGVGAGTLSGGIVEWLPVHESDTVRRQGAAAAGATAAARPAGNAGASPVVPSRWQVRMEGTTWLERLIFEYVEKIVLCAATTSPPPPPPPPSAPPTPAPTA